MDGGHLADSGKSSCCKGWRGRTDEGHLDSAINSGINSPRKVQDMSAAVVKVY